ncbi:protein POLLEN DEFECTIVE IN GUIDANCE 1 [Ricinus communis]|uniref:protein POLLEN DEFECTIVE IN GUIDANCE 1 n=1 Tax=Ricinus communis TaxID=3988 RepID=UPI00077298C9|nr:protein POLLEN DEFECTIVE IN GUIDANCE 1 [Ricinus communis]|eukprot:XP_015579895.1 protein POLLEN DEFECTIVE IN GUIDANCE 1 [Ricinus communis]
MALRSSGRKLSFEVLNESESSSIYGLHYKSNTDPIDTADNKVNRKKKKHKKKKHHSSSIIPEEHPIHENSFFPDSNSIPNTTIENGSLYLENITTSTSSFIGGGGGSVVCTVSDVPEIASVLRQRNVSNGGGGGGGEELASSSEKAKESGVEVNSPEEKQWRSEGINGFQIPKLEPAESLDWNRLMAAVDPNFENSPGKYFMEEMRKGNALRSTTTLGSEKERERVYDTIFRLPWRCELLIDVGFFVCLDSFLSLLTIMPTRILITIWRFLNTRQFKKPSASELSDIGCFIVLTSGVALLEHTDISLIYHMIRGQGTIKLYVVYNVLEIFDKLCQSFGGDVLQTLFNSAEGLASCSKENMRFWMWRFISDQALAMAFSILHSFILLAQAITLSTCIVAHNNALMALLVSNNFAEIKSNVFKRFSKDNIHSLVYSDSVERFHISAFLLFVLAQNILEAEGPWFESFLSNALMVFFCEMLIDIIKHSFLAKFNDIRPIAYSEFLEELCNQTLNIQTEDKKKHLTFIPLAPACVVIRVLTPVYAAHLPYSPFSWRFFWILLLSAMTYVMLTSLKVMIGMGLQKHATWYVNRCRKRKNHLHSD